jgi:hypothetical protein
MRVLPCSNIGYRDRRMEGRPPETEGSCLLAVSRPPVPRPSRGNRRRSRRRRRRPHYAGWGYRVGAFLTDVGLALCVAFLAAIALAGDDEDAQNAAIGFGIVVTWFLVTSVESEDPDAWPRTLRNAMADGIAKCS